MKKYIFLSLALTCLFTSTAFAASTGLKAQVRFDLPRNVKTVSQAAMWFLEPHGYRLALGGVAPQEAIAIALQPLPNTLPNGRVMTIEAALLAITQNNQAVVIDNNHKLVSFEIYIGGVQK